ncbi:hypothetical protein B0J13DRAFT_611481 [Dactylonectria estremocensis]|uniref:Uncharacterized protein n=1 Tax=Dactylonectria estremocensis TaxID=1079267 RepID=A0A9P9IMG0_9HYPO|nr:hypothetical protein B0J13DRAFT_611481 [Dactylonectria estremocensis]
MHIIYDTANFTTVSMCASLINVYSQDRERGWSRLSSLITFAAAYLSFTIVFGIKLIHWSHSLPAHCYNTKFIAYPGHSHPKVDLAYLGVTCFYCLGCLWGCVSCHRSLNAVLAPLLSPLKNAKFGSRELQKAYLLFLHPNRLSELAPGIVLAAMVQYPLHLYMVIALRASNESRLNGDSENAWGFGQIVALIAAVSTILECFRGISDYYSQVPELGNETDLTAQAETEENPTAVE